MPAWAFTISPSAQSVIPSPYARQRPCRQVDELGVGVDDSLQLVDEAALADAGHADEREELRRALVPCAFECVADDRELALAADELGARVVCRRRRRSARRASSACQTATGSDLPFASTVCGSS